MGKEKLADDPVRAAKKAAKKSSKRKAQEQKRDADLSVKTPTALEKEISRVKAQHGESASTRLQQLRDAKREAERKKQQQQNATAAGHSIPKVHGLDSLRPDGASASAVQQNMVPSAPSSRSTQAVAPPSSTPPALRRSQPPECQYTHASIVSPPSRPPPYRTGRQTTSQREANENVAGRSGSGRELAPFQDWGENAAQLSEQVAENQDAVDSSQPTTKDTEQNLSDKLPPRPGSPPPPPEEEEVDEEPLPPPALTEEVSKSAPIITSESTATRAEHSKTLTGMVPHSVAAKRHRKE